MLLFLVGLALTLLILEARSVKTALKKVDYDISVSRHTLEPGEPFDLMMTVCNQKWLPLMFLRVQQTLPQEMLFSGRKGDLLASGEQLISTARSLRLNSTVYLMPRQRRTFKYSVSLPARGRYFLRGATLTGGDFLGARQTERPWMFQKEMIVLPPRPEKRALFSAVGGFLGDLSVNRFIFEDPVLTVGYREYTGREPMKSLSWLQSARAGRLMVKQYDYTKDMTVTVLLNVECPPDIDRGKAVETCFSMTRGVCEKLEELGVQYRILTNATAAGAVGMWSEISDGLGQKHLSTVLEGLGRATYDQTEAFALTLEKAVRGARQGRAHVVILPRVLPEYEHWLKRLKELSGGQVSLIETAKREEA